MAFVDNLWDRQISVKSNNNHQSKSNHGIRIWQSEGFGSGSDVNNILHFLSELVNNQNFMKILAKP